MDTNISPYFSNTMPAKRKHIKPVYDTEEESQNGKPNKEDSNCEAPANWKQVYENIRTMRDDRSAPVDSMGCERSFDEDVSPAEQRFQCLISLMLSSQTKDEINYAAMTRLKQHGLTIDNILATSDQKLGELIIPVGFWKKKVNYIKEVCKVLKEKYNSDIPRTVKELCELKGVGPKMAHICMSVAWEESTGIGVDTHVHRICGRLGWTHGCKTPEATRKALESWLPKDRWLEINWLLVGFGQQVCVPINPKCGECLNRKICPVGKTWKPPSKKKTSPAKKAKKD